MNAKSRMKNQSQLLAHQNVFDEKEKFFALLWPPTKFTSFDDGFFHISSNILLINFVVRALQSICETRVGTKIIEFPFDGSFETIKFLFGAI
jgi:hypothetical protein